MVLAIVESIFDVEDDRCNEEFAEWLLDVPSDCRCC